METTKCERCGKEDSVWIDWEYKVLGNRLCYSCKKEKERQKEKETILNTEPDEDYRPYSDDNGYYCPYCGEFNDMNHDFYELYEDGDHEVECHFCNKSFTVTTYVSYSFESRRE